MRYWELQQFTFTESFQKAAVHWDGNQQPAALHNSPSFPPHWSACGSHTTSLCCTCPSWGWPTGCCRWRPCGVRAEEGPPPPEKQESWGCSSLCQLCHQPKTCLATWEEGMLSLCYFYWEDCKVCELEICLVKCFVYLEEHWNIVMFLLFLHCYLRELLLTI